MANTKGIRLFREVTTGATDVKSYAEKDVSSLAIVLPCSVTMRCRFFVSANATGGINLIGGIYVVMGGASDDRYQIIELISGNDDIFNLHQLTVDADDQDRTNGTSENSANTAVTQKDWFWMQLDLDSSANLTINIKDDNTTTKPSTWDITTTHSQTANITPSQEMQTVGILCRLDKTEIASTNNRIIVEVDEIYVEQN